MCGCWEQNPPPEPPTSSQPHEVPQRWPSCGRAGGHGALPGGPRAGTSRVQPAPRRWAVTKGRSEPATHLHRKRSSAHRLRNAGGASPLPLLYLSFPCVGPWAQQPQGLNPGRRYCTPQRFLFRLSTTKTTPRVKKSPNFFFFLWSLGTESLIIRLFVFILAE